MTPRNRSAVVNLRILVIVAIVYVFSAKGYIEVQDTFSSVNTARAIVERGALDIDRIDKDALVTADGHSYSKYGIGLAFYFVPFVAAGDGLARMGHVSPDRVTQFLISFANIPFAVLTLILFARLLEEFHIRSSTIRLLTVALGLGTLCWRYAAYDFSESMQMCLLLLAVLGLLRERTDGVVWSGIGFAALILVKLVHLALLPLLVGYLLLGRKAPSVRHRVEEFGRFTGPVLIAGLILAWLNWIRFGSAFESGYGSEARQFVASQLWRTVPRLIGSLDKGLLPFCPVLALGILGWPEFARQRRPEAALLGAVITTTILLAGAWHSWEGGWSWGPRLLLVALPLWLVPAAFWLEHGRQLHAKFAAAVVLTGASIVAQLPGVLVKDQQIHQARYNLTSVEDQRYFLPDLIASWVFLWHKLRLEGEIYQAAELAPRIPRDYAIDMSAYRTFSGFNVWAAHLVREMGHKTVVVSPQ